MVRGPRRGVPTQATRILVRDSSDSLGELVHTKYHPAEWEDTIVKILGLDIFVKVGSFEGIGDDHRSVARSGKIDLLSNLYFQW